jgi:hypothetical protein
MKFIIVIEIIIIANIKFILYFQEINLSVYVLLNIEGNNADMSDCVLILDTLILPAVL